MARPESPTEPGAAADAEAFVREHQAGIWRYLRLLGASAEDADDLLQETLLRYLRRRFAPGNATAVLRTIARGLWVDRHRWLRRRRVVRWADEVDSALAATPDGDEGIWLEALGRCRARLTDRAQRALDLAYRDGRGRQEIASELGIAANTVRNLLAATRDALRQCIEKRIGELEGDER